MKEGARKGRVSMNRFRGKQRVRGDGTGGDVKKGIRYRREGLSRTTGKFEERGITGETEGRKKTKARGKLTSTVRRNMIVIGAQVEEKIQPKGKHKIP